MDLKAGIYNYLSGFPSTTAILGVGATFRLYPDFAPENATTNGGIEPPFVVYTLDSTDRPYHLRGASGIAWAYYSFIIYSPDSVTRNAVKECLRNILHGRLNFVLNNATEVIFVNSSYLTGESESFDPPDDGDDKPSAFASNLEFTFCYIEPLPTGE